MDTKKVYNNNAAKWLRLEPSSLSDFTARPAVFEACGELNNRSVLDIGCGEGYCARALKQQGAGDYLGIDLSSKMIEAAIAQEAHDQYGIEYKTCDVTTFKSERKFDLCIAVFLFNYTSIAAMATIMTRVYESLSTGGEFIFTIPHPFFPFIHPEKKPPFYFDGINKNYFKHVDEQFEGEIWKRNGEPLHVQCVHKTFADYFTALSKAGFNKMPDVTELTVTDEIANIDKDFFSPLINQPLHVLFKLTK